MKQERGPAERDMTAREAPRMAVSEMPEAFALHEMIFDESGRAADYRFVEVNPPFTALTGLAAEAVVGRTASTILPGSRKWVERCEPVVRTGMPARFEERDEQLGRTYEVTAFRPRAGQFACVYSDVTEKRAAEAKIRRRQERHAALAEASLDGYAVMDLEGRILAVNESYCRIVDYTAEELAGKVVSELEGKESGAETREHLERVAREGRDRFETRLKRKDGSLVDVEVSATALREAGEILVFIREIGGRKRMEAEREDMLHLLRLLNRPNDTHELVQLLTGFLQEWSGCEAVGVRLKDEEDFPYFETRGFPGEFVVEERRLCGAEGQGLECLCGALLSSNPLPAATAAGSFWTNDLEGSLASWTAEESPARMRGQCVAEGYRSLALVRLRSMRETVGLLQFADRRAGRLSAEKIAFLEQAAASIAIGLEQRAAQAALRRSEERFRAIADYTVEWENWFGVEGRLLWVNPAVERLTGYTAEECYRMEGFPLALAHEADAERAREGFGQVRNGMRGQDLELRLRHKNGEERWCSISWQPIYGSEGQALGHRSSVRDISARKRERSVLEARVKLAEYARSHSLAELLEETINEAERLTGSRIGFYHFLEDDERTVLLEAWSTRTRTEMCKATEGGEHYSIDQAGVWVDAVRERRAVIHNDYAALKHRKGMPRGHAKVERELVAPAFRGQRIVALLGVGNKARDYDERDAELVSQLADFAWDIVEWKRTEEALKASERNYRELVEQLPLGTIVHREGRVEYVNGEAARILGLEEKAEALGEEVARFAGGMEEEGSGREGKWRRVDGRVIDVEWTTARVQYEGREAVHVVFRDITRTKLLEQQFIQAQKMESLGRLAGGVAHDFNNLLTVINGYCELLLGERKQRMEPRAAIEQIQTAGERAARLVGQMLAFSRKQVLQVEPLDAGEVVSGLTTMLARLLGEDIEVRTELAAGLEKVRADRTQLEQVLLNLAVNARDAMPAGGVLTISTEGVDLERGECRACGGTVGPGPYVRIGVRDTGTGMDAETLRHLFEPFFTTKERGKGTGLGLAMVHGTVMQCGGHLDVKSEPGCGSRFDIYLPAQSESQEGTAGPKEEGDCRGRERILLVEDQEGVRNYAAQVLRSYGYEVVAAGEPEEALEAARGARIDLLATDVVMPRLSGAELARRMRAEVPAMKVLFISGYPGDELAPGTGSGPGEGFLGKPFSPQALGRAVRELLDGG